jgi:hypothetical protein
MLEITVDTSAFENEISKIGNMHADIVQDATSDRGFRYFYPVDLGRGPVVAKNAKALRITLPDGRVIFRKSVGPAAPRNIRLNSLPEVMGSAINAGVVARGDSIRGWLLSFLGMCAFYFAQVLAEHTPVSPLPGGGKLKQSYRATPAVES